MASIPRQGTPAWKETSRANTGSSRHPPDKIRNPTTTWRWLPLNWSTSVLQADERNDLHMISRPVSPPLPSPAPPERISTKAQHDSSKSGYNRKSLPGRRRRGSHLRHKGQAISPGTVPSGTAHVRLQVSILSIFIPPQRRMCLLKSASSK